PAIVAVPDCGRKSCFATDRHWHSINGWGSSKRRGAGMAGPGPDGWLSCESRSEVVLWEAGSCSAPCRRQDQKPTHAGGDQCHPDQLDAPGRFVQKAARNDLCENHLDQSQCPDIRGRGQGETDEPE